MEKRYEWRELTDDGLLKAPKDCGPHYDRDESLPLGAWGTEEEAVAAYSEFLKKHEYSANSELVLVCIWRRKRDA